MRFGLWKEIDKMKEKYDIRPVTMLLQALDQMEVSCRRELSTPCFLLTLFSVTLDQIKIFNTASLTHFLDTFSLAHFI